MANMKWTDEWINDVKSPEYRVSLFDRQTVSLRAGHVQRPGYPSNSQIFRPTSLGLPSNGLGFRLGFAIMTDGARSFETVPRIDAPGEDSPDPVLVTECRGRIAKPVGPIRLRLERCT